MLQVEIKQSIAFLIENAIISDYQYNAVEGKWELIGYNPVVKQHLRATVLDDNIKRLDTQQFYDFIADKFGKQKYPEGFYYKVKDKLNKLQKAMDYPNQGNPDNRMLEGILIKFERDNKISSEHMKICNELWNRYK